MILSWKLQNKKDCRGFLREKEIRKKAQIAHD